MFGGRLGWLGVLCWDLLSFNPLFVIRCLVAGLGVFSSRDLVWIVYRVDWLDSRIYPKLDSLI